MADVESAQEETKTVETKLARKKSSKRTKKGKAGGKSTRAATPVPDQSTSDVTPDAPVVEEQKTQAAANKKTAPKKAKRTGPKKGGTNTTDTAQNESNGELSGDRATIYNYMKQQNRPYSALNIFDNLRGAIKKPEVIRILDALSTEGLIRAKDFGKARVYLVDQSVFPEVDDEQIDALDKQISELKAQIGDIKEENRRLDEELKAKRRIPPLDDVRREADRIHDANVQLKSKIAKFESGEIEPVSEVQLAAAKEATITMERASKLRRRWVMELVNMFADAMEQKPATLMDEMDLELE